MTLYTLHTYYCKNSDAVVFYFDLARDVTYRKGPIDFTIKIAAMIYDGVSAKYTYRFGCNVYCPISFIDKRYAAHLTMVIPLKPQQY
jgi:hypothetical protein